METNTEYRPTKVVVDLNAIRENVKNLKDYLPLDTAVIAVVKADGYGHGEVETARAAFQAGASMVSVATPDEALRLREGGITGDILVMGPSPAAFARIASKLGIHVTATGAEWLRQATRVVDETGQSLKVHVKIDTGMGRIGVRSAEAIREIVEVFNTTDVIELIGAFTHFACADEDDPITTKRQFDTFTKLVESFPVRPSIVHAANSSATFLYPDYALDAVRFGISLYGIAPSAHVESRLPFKLHRALRLETEIAYVKHLEKGNKISYGGTYETAEDEWIGTLPIGYADGLKRGLRGQEVLIAGERMPIVGTICMDQCMVKLPRPMTVGEKVIVLGRQGDEEVTMEEWADRIGTIPYEIAVTLSKRVPRVYENTNG